MHDESNVIPFSPKKNKACHPQFGDLILTWVEKYFPLGYVVVIHPLHTAEADAYLTQLFPEVTQDMRQTVAFFVKTFPDPGSMVDFVSALNTNIAEAEMFEDGESCGDTTEDIE